MLRKSEELNPPIGKPLLSTTIQHCTKDYKKKLIPLNP